MNSEELAKRISALLDERKAEDIAVYDVRGVSSITDFNILANGTSSPHLRALIGDLRSALKKEGVPFYRDSGDPESGWVVLDFVDVIVHVFTAEAREYYDLDGIWKRAK